MPLLVVGQEPTSLTVVSSEDRLLLNDNSAEGKKTPNCHYAIEYTLYGATVKIYAAWLWTSKAMVQYWPPAFPPHRHHHHNVTDDLDWTKRDEVTKVILWRGRQVILSRRRVWLPLSRPGP
jgi:hypothetical protein